MTRCRLPSGGELTIIVNIFNQNQKCNINKTKTSQTKRTPKGCPILFQKPPRILEANVHELQRRVRRVAHVCVSLTLMQQMMYSRLQN